MVACILQTDIAESFHSILRLSTEDDRIQINASCHERASPTMGIILEFNVVVIITRSGGIDLLQVHCPLLSLHDTGVLTTLVLYLTPPGKLKEPLDSSSGVKDLHLQNKQRPCFPPQNQSNRMRSERHPESAHGR